MICEFFVPEIPAPPLTDMESLVKEKKSKYEFIIRITMTTLQF